MSLLAWIPGTRAWRDRREDVLCRRTYERLQEIVDGEVAPGPDTQQLVEHLDKCARCGEERDAFEELKRAIHRLESREGQDLAQRLTPVLRRIMDGESDAPV